MYDTFLVLLPNKPQGVIAIIDIDQAPFLHCQGALSVSEDEGRSFSTSRRYLSDQGRKYEHRDWEGVLREILIKRQKIRVVNLIERWLVTLMRYRSPSESSIKAKLDEHDKITPDPRLDSK